MSTETTPTSVEELATTLGDYGKNKQKIELGGNFTKRAMGGAVRPASAVVSTRSLNRIIAYEPTDLTISVESGMKYCDLDEALRAEGQMLPLDPAFADSATIGGVVATNGSGPRRRHYGTARDMVIGMKMVTLEGSIVQSGGMVVKNVTGLDMAKLMIGSFGTLAAMASINFKVFPRPAFERTFIGVSESLDKILQFRRAILKSLLQPTALDLLNGDAAGYLPGDFPDGYLLLSEAGGNRPSVERYEREYAQIAKDCGVPSFHVLAGEEAAGIWRAIQNLTPAAAGEQGFILRVSTIPTRLGEIFQPASSGNGPLPILARAGASVGYLYCSSPALAKHHVERVRAAGLSVVVEYAGATGEQDFEHWPEPGPDFEIMQRIKDSLDPDHLLNTGRLFGRI